METVVLKIENVDTEKEKLKTAGGIIKNGGLVAFPTETVYGLGGDALKEHSSEKIYEAKGRPSDNPLIVHICDIEDLEKIARNIPKEAYSIAEAFWPGPLTMIFQKKECVPKETTGGLDTVAVRMPAHDLALAFIREAGGFIAAPSANLSGKPSPTSAKHVYDDLHGRIDMILDGGETGIGLESTIIDLTSSPPSILRPGYINEEMLKEVLENVEMDKGILPGHDENIRPKAPGMKYRHYAPKAELILVEGPAGNVSEKILQLVKEAEQQGKKAGIITCEEHKEFYQGRALTIAGSLEKEETIAHNLYSILRDFDETDMDVIYSETFETPKIGTAIMNRLMKAAGQRKITARF